ncbi:MAG: phospholipid carrier-dependent glycosyltransferase [Acidobacteria bacterium]|nr:phospholipid carrier-dependent glycosyltransferase [Acidobacteriota bacterium]
MKRQWHIVTIIVLSGLTHFLFFGQPNETVADEVHFGKYISGYFSHEYFFDVHPPLAKLMISGMGYVGGFRPGFAFAKIGEAFPDKTYLWLRFLPTLAGAVLPVVIYYLSIQLGISRLGALTAALLIIVDNALLVQSRFILLDSLLLLFGFSSLLFYFSFQSGKKLPYLLLAGACGALATSIKWTGVTFLALVVVLEAIRWVRERSWSGASFARAFGSLIVLPLIIYFSIVALHLGLLYKSGPGDAFMTPRFQKTLQGSRFAEDTSIGPLGLVEKFQELNVEMYRANATLTAGHPYGSKWYSWPFHVRPIFYWVKKVNTSESARIYLLGNPVAWWCSTAAMLYIMMSLLFLLFMRPSVKWKLVPSAALLLTGAWLFNLLPFIGITRVMFLYHYMTALVFAYIATAYLIDKLASPALFVQPATYVSRHGSREETASSWTFDRNLVYAMLLIGSIAAFLFFSPLTYGLPLSESSYDLRVWLPSWK